MLTIRLLNLALEAFGKYLSYILVKLSTLSDVNSIEVFNTEYLHPLCNKLEKIIHEFVPSNLADFVSENLRTELLNTYNYLQHSQTKKKHSHNSCEEESCYTETATIALCSAVLHPSVQAFKFSRAQLPLISQPRVKIFIDAFLHTMLEKLTHIKYLKLEIYKFDENIVLEILKTMSDLEELTFFGCTNAIVELVSNVCPKLRFLDIKNSVSINDSSVESILKLRHMEHLNIQRTSILPEGIEKIISSKFLLQSFKSHIEYYQVAIIPKCFPNLRSVDICVHEDFNLLPFRYLKHLSHLAISFIDVEAVSSIHLEELLKAIGYQLISLKLYDFLEVEFIDVFRLIGENCNSLKSISLITICYYWQYLNHHIPEAKHLPELTSVENFEVKMYSRPALEAVLPRIVNLKVIKLCEYNARFRPLLMKLLFHMREGHLEKIYLDGCEIQIDGENIIIAKLNGSYAYIHLENFGSVIDKILGVNNIYIIDKCFMDIPNYAYLK